MTGVELLKWQLGVSREMLSGQISQLSDEEFFFTAKPGLNHVGWNVGHVIVTECEVLKLLGREVTEVPQEYIDRFKMGTTVQAKDKNYPGREALENMLDATRNTTLDLLGSLDEAALDAEVTGGPDYLPTVGAALSFLVVHESMHLGQITMIGCFFENRSIV